MNRETVAVRSIADEISNEAAAVEKGNTLVNTDRGGVEQNSLLTSIGTGVVSISISAWSTCGTGGGWSTGAREGNNGWGTLIS